MRGEDTRTTSDKWKVLYKRVEYLMSELGEKSQRVCIPVDFNKDRIWDKEHIEFF